MIKDILTFITGFFKKKETPVISKVENVIPIETPKIEINNNIEIKENIMEKENVKPENTIKIIDKFLKENAYTAVNTKKTRICLHHTVSSPYSQDGDISTWNQGRNVATQYLIGHDGTIFKCFPNNFWAHHLGMKVANNTLLNQQTIGIEIDAWGPLTKNAQNQFITAYNRPLATPTPVEELDKNFRGFKFYQEYYQAQIDALKLLLIYLSKEHNIPLVGLNKTLNFEMLPASEYEKSGIFSHTNFRTDKSDVYPAKKLIAMLKTL